MKGISSIAQVPDGQGHPQWRLCVCRHWWDTGERGTNPALLVQSLLSLVGWGCQEGSWRPPAFQSLLSALIHLMNYTLKQLHTEGGAGKEASLTIN